jgi:hypothetical protein
MLTYPKLVFSVTCVCLLVYKELITIDGALFVWSSLAISFFLLRAELLICFD